MATSFAAKVSGITCSSTLISIHIIDILVSFNHLAEMIGSNFARVGITQSQDS
jgi:hypothetical protein